MAGEELKLLATFEDRATAQMRTTLDRLRGFGKEGERLGERGARSTKLQTAEFVKLSKAVQETSGAFRDGFLPGLEKTTFSAMQAGVGLGTVAAALGLAGSAAKTFATNVLEFKQASRETGLSVDEVRQWETLGKFIGVSGDAMRGALGSFNDLVQQMERRPDLFRQMFANPQNAGMAQLRDFMLSLRGLPRAEQLSGILDFVGKIRDVGQRKEVFAFLHLPPQLANETAENLRAYLDSIRSVLTPWTAEQEKMGLEAAVNWIALGAQFEDLSNIVGATFVPALNSALKSTNEWIAANKGLISTNLKTWFDEAAADAKLFAEDVQYLTDKFFALEDWLSKHSLKHYLFDNGKPIFAPWKPEDGAQVQPQSYSPSPDRGGGFQPAAFHVAGGQDLRAGMSSSTADAIEIIAQGTRRGVLDGMTDFAQSMGGGAGGAGGVGRGGLMNASYSPGGGAGYGGLRDKLGGGGSAGAGGAGGKFMDALARIESGNRNIYSGVDKDYPGQPGSRSQGYFQIDTPTWRDFAKRAGVDLGKYPNAMSAPRDVQEQVARMIPLSRFGPRTRRMLAGEFGPLDFRKPVGQLGPQGAIEGSDGGKVSADYRGLRLKSGEAVSGGGAVDGLLALARRQQETEGGIFSALNDRFHHNLRYHSKHTEGLAFDEVLPRGDYEAARERVRSYLSKTGMKPGEYWIEPGTNNHLHVQFQSRGAAERYRQLSQPKPVQSSLLDSARRSGVMAPGGLHKVAGEASLSVKLAAGLAPDGGVRTSGNLFKEVKLERGGIPYANTMA